jgi:hypothetical protein
MIGGVMGALMALEQRFPLVGASLVTVFFPGNMLHDPGRLDFQWEKDFWEEALRPEGQPTEPRDVRKPTAEDPVAKTAGKEVGEEHV